MRTGLLQLELAPGIVASALRGTTFKVKSGLGGDGALEFTVVEGSLRIIQLRTGQLAVVGPGQYELTITGRALVRPRITPGAFHEASRHYDLYIRQDINLADSILLRQNQKLEIDTRTFIKGIFGIFGR